MRRILVQTQVHTAVRVAPPDWRLLCSRQTLDNNTMHAEPRAAGRAAFGNNVFRRGPVIVAVIHLQHTQAFDWIRTGSFLEASLTTLRLCHRCHENVWCSNLPFSVTIRMLCSFCDCSTDDRVAESAIRINPNSN